MSLKYNNELSQTSKKKKRKIYLRLMRPTLKYHLQIKLISMNYKTKIKRTMERAAEKMRRNTLKFSRKIKTSKLIMRIKNNNHYPY